MKQTYALLASLAILSLSAPAFADSNETTKASGTDASGTTSKIEQNVKVKTYKNGETKTTIHTEASKDPKGLMNKSKVKSEEETTTDANGNVIKDTKTVSGTVKVETK